MTEEERTPLIVKAVQQIVGLPVSAKWIQINIPATWDKYSNSSDEDLLAVWLGADK